MKMVRKVLASLAITGMTLTLAPFNSFATIGSPFSFVTTEKTARLFGSDRIGTSVAVADEGWTAADTVILAPAGNANLVDALAAAPLAGSTDPILLTDNNTLDLSTQAELVKLGAKKVYVVGALSESVVDQVNAIKGVTASVLKGSDRIGTAAAVSAELSKPAGTFVVGYNGLADALSVASFAAANNYSILVANPDGSFPASEAAYLGSKVYLIGGPTLVKDIPGATRLFGADRFATNQAVLSALTYKYDHVYVANGTDTHLVDSLIAASLAARTNSPIVLTDPNEDGLLASTSVNRKLDSTSVVTALGGHSLVTDANIDLITNFYDYGSGTGSDSMPPAGTAVTGISLNHPTLSLTPGGAAGPLVATVFPTDAMDQAVTWTTSDADVATVANGVVTPLKTGTGIITATTDDGAKTAACTVTVTDVTSGGLGVAADLSGFTQSYPLLSGIAAPSLTIKVYGDALTLDPIDNTANDMSKITTAYDRSWNASFVAAPFNSYPALSPIPSQGLTMNITSDKNGVITNVDGYTLASLPNEVTVSANSSGEVSVNAVQLWKAQSGYKVVGYMPGSTSGSATLIEENLSIPVNFIGVKVPSLGSSGTQDAAWTLPLTSLPGNFEDFLGFNVNSKGQLQPIVAGYFESHSMLAPYSTNVSALAIGTFSPVEAAQVYVSDSRKESVVVTVNSSLNSKTATISAEFLGPGGFPIGICSSNISGTLGEPQTITLDCMDVLGNPLANQTLYIGTGIPGLWLTGVNGKTINESVNMGTASSPSMQTVNTPVPLFNPESLASAPAYSSVSAPGLKASNLNNNTSPIVALTTGDDGKISITLADGNVNYVGTSGSTPAINSYKTDPGTVIPQQDLGLFTAPDQATMLEVIPLKWGNSPNLAVTGVNLNQTALSLTAGGAPAVLLATVAPSIALNQTVTWSSNNSNVTVATNGVVTPVSAGTAVITATTQDGGKTATCIATVAAP